jgi:hypothetical protein
MAPSSLLPAAWRRGAGVRGEKRETGGSDSLDVVVDRLTRNDGDAKVAGLERGPSAVG